MEQHDVSYLFRRDAIEHQRRVASIAGSVSSADALSARQWAVTLLVLAGLSLALSPLFAYAPTVSVRIATARWATEGKLVVDLQHTYHHSFATLHPGDTVTLNVTSTKVRLSALCVVTSVIEEDSGSTEQLAIDVSQPVRRAMEAKDDAVHMNLEFKDSQATLWAALKRMLEGNRS